MAESIARFKSSFLKVNTLRLPRAVRRYKNHSGRCFQNVPASVKDVLREGLSIFFDTGKMGKRRRAHFVLDLGVLS
jgi:hypothetical protein